MRKRKKLTPVLQVAAGDCGLACLSMVLQTFGTIVGVHELRGAMGTSINGMSLKRILEAAGKFSLSGRAVRASIDQVSLLTLPAILHWDFNHYVILEEVALDAVVIIDPNLGRRTISKAELSDRFTGIAVEFWAMKPFRRTRRLIRGSLRDLWSSITGVKRSVLIICGLSVAVQTMVLLGPLLFAVLVDQAVTYSSTRVAWVVIVAVVLANSFSVAGDLLRRHFLLNLGTRLSSQISHNLVHHLLSLPYAYFQQRRLADLLTRVDSTRFIKDALTEGAVPVVVDGVFSLLTLALLLRLNPGIAAVPLAFLFVFTLVKFATYRTLRSATEEMIDRQCDEQSTLMETIRGIQVIKTMNAERLRLSAWHGANSQSLRSNRKVQQLVGALTGFRAWVMSLDFAVVAGACAVLVINGRITVGLMFAVVALRQQFQDRAYPLIDRLFEFKLLRMRMERLSDITQAEPELERSIVDPRLCIVKKGNVVIKDLSYRYSPDLPWIIKDLSLEINAGEFLAINGRSGGGKSTLMCILTGLLKPEKGQIFVDGTLLEDKTLEAFRSDIGAVMQDDRLFSGTIFDNISGFDPNADDELVRKAADLAEIGSDIDEMPMGYFSFIGDMGSSLSGGQKQRLLLARALYRQPKILFLDEGTANLDPSREARIVDMLRGLRITVVCVAHRSRTLESADRLYELEHGRLKAHYSPERRTTSA